MKRYLFTIITITSLFLASGIKAMSKEAQFKDFLDNQLLTSQIDILQGADDYNPNVYGLGRGQHAADLAKHYGIRTEKAKQIFATALLDYIVFYTFGITQAHPDYPELRAACKIRYGNDIMQEAERWFNR
jgi:hypothetical protein